MLNGKKPDRVVDKFNETFDIMVLGYGYAGGNIAKWFISGRSAGRHAANVRG